MSELQPPTRRPWAAKRRLQYFSGLVGVIVFVVLLSYMKVLYVPPSCVDGKHNNNESGVDCGGPCIRICAEDTEPLVTQWARSFRVKEGQYNAVAYIENRNFKAGAPVVNYTFKLYDEAGLITERPGSTVIPPDSIYPIFEGRIDTAGRVPTRTFIDIEPPALWLPGESTRNQFKVENRVLTRADSIPRLDVEITNQSLEQAKDVEIIATIFDLGRNALTASQTIVPVLPGKETQRVVFTWPEPIATTIRSCEVPTDVVLAIDLSGSMNNDGVDPPEPVTSVLTAARSFVDRLGSRDQAAIVTYATEAELVQGLSRDLRTVGQVIANLEIDPESEQGSTNTGEAIQYAYREISSDAHNPDARKVVVLLTDGLANEPEENPEQYAIDAAEMLKETDTKLYVIGLGTDVNETFLETIASSEEHYYRAASADTVDEIYRTITAALCENGVAVIDVLPKAAITFPQ